MVVLYHWIKDHQILGEFKVYSCCTKGSNKSTVPGSLMMIGLSPPIAYLKTSSPKSKTFLWPGSCIGRPGHETRRLETFSLVAPCISVCGTV